MPCYDEGQLRAFLDHALPAAEHAAVEAHLAGCAACRTYYEQQCTSTAQLGQLLAMPTAHSDPHAALARLRAGIGSTPPNNPVAVAATAAATPSPRRNPMQTTPTLPNIRRRLMAGVAAIVVLVGLLALPPVRAAAEQFLQIFRVQGVLFVPISQERLAQLEQLDFEGSTLFVEEPTLVNQPAEPRSVVDAAAAAAAVGFPLSAPAELPTPAHTIGYVVHDYTVMQFRVNVESARQLFALLNIDVTLPDTLGSEPIIADVPPFVATNYRATDYTLTLYQGMSPTVTLPDGVDLAQLGIAGLQVLGMSREEATTLGSQIDWSSTLIFPFPGDIADFREVQLGDTRGLLVGGGERNRRWQIYWQNGTRFLMLEGSGRINEAEFLAIAASIR